MNFNNILEELKQNKENHKNGYYNCIPFMGMDRLEKFIPGIEMSTYYLLTASSGVGKSKLGRFLFIHNPFTYLHENEDSDIEISIKYFSLEESKKKIILTEISRYLHTKYGLEVSVKQLQSRGRYNTIDESVFAKIEEAEEYVNKFLESIDIQDSIRNPTGIYKYMRDFAMKIGRYYKKDGTPFTDAEMQMVIKGKGDLYKEVSYYKKDNPKHYVIVLTDHVSLLQTENRMTQWQTMTKYSSDYCLRMRDKFGFTIVNIQQQASDKERVEFNFKGDSINSKLEPSLDGLGDNKTTQRDADIVLGLFAPNRYNISESLGYNIDILKDNFRSMKILKDRDGIANKQVPLFFNGAVDFFKELPRPDDNVNMRKVYQYIKKIRE